MLAPCTPEHHVFSGWIIGTVCQCGATEVRLKPELGTVSAEPREGAGPEPQASPEPVAVTDRDRLDTELAADAKQAEGEADAEAQATLDPPTRRRR